jgi:hypothetical protein
MTLILFTDRTPHPLAEGLMDQGHQVFEDLSSSEVYALADQHPAATIIISADVHPERAEAVQHHYPTLHLKLAATVQDIVWKLGQGKCAPIQ